MLHYPRRVPRLPAEFATPLRTKTSGEQHEPIHRGHIDFGGRPRYVVGIGRERGPCPLDFADLSEVVIQAYEALNDDDKQALDDLTAALTVAFSTSELVEGDTSSEAAQLAVQGFLGSDDTEWWRCDDSYRFISDDGCGEDGCPVTLAANPAMSLGRVTFAGTESYGLYGIRGLERRWDWCLDDDSFGCAFVLQAGGDGEYYDFEAPSTTTRSNGSRVATPAGRFKCERYSPPSRNP